MHLRIKAEMERHHLTPATLARKTGIDLHNVCHILAGRNKTLNSKTLCKLLLAMPRANARKLLLG